MLSEDLDYKYEVRVLKPSEVRLFRSDPRDIRVRLTLDGNRSWYEVRIARAFPFSNPEHYIGLRDGADKEIGVLENLEGIDPESLRIIREELERRYFTPRVSRVLSVKEEHGTVTWECETNRGPRRFVIRNIRDNAYSLSPGRMILTDTDGNRYEFPEISALGPKAYAVLAKVM